MTRASVATGNLLALAARLNSANSSLWSFIVIAFVIVCFLGGLPGPLRNLIVSMNEKYKARKKFCQGKNKEFRKYFLTLY
jgi:Sec-independent protein translocase protein TatA